MPPDSQENAAISAVSNALRNIVLGAFLLYCLVPAVWIITAMSKDIGQLFLTFGLCRTSPARNPISIGRSNEPGCAQPLA